MNNLPKWAYSLIIVTCILIVITYMWLIQPITNRGLDTYQRMIVNLIVIAPFVIIANWSRNRKRK